MTLAVVLLVCGGLGVVGIIGIVITLKAGARRAPTMKMTAERRRMLIEAQEREES